MRSTPPRLLAIAVIAMTTPNLARSAFPDVDQLPDRPGMPDPLVMLDGTPVKTADQWREQRRPELIALFEWYMYGSSMPAPEISVQVEKTTDVLDGKAKMKQVAIRFGPPGRQREGGINLLVFAPTKRAAAPRSFWV